MASTADPRLAAYLVVMAKLGKDQDLTEDISGEVRGLSISFTVLAFLFVVLRYGAKYKQGGKYALDDWLLVVSTGFLIGNTVLLCTMLKFGLGKHSAAVAAGPNGINNAMMVGKLLLAHEPLLFVNLTIVKTSILVMYHRLFPSRVVRTRALTLGIIAVVWTIILLGIAEGQCIPLKKAYAPWIAGHCFNLKITLVAIALPSIILDSLIVILPLPQVWKLDINRAQKISLSLIFLMGGFVVLMSIYRFVVLFEYHALDPIFTLARGTAWNIVVLASAIIAACLPALGPMFRVVFKSLRESRASRNDVIEPHALSNLPRDSNQTTNGICSIASQISTKRASLSSTDVSGSIRSIRRDGSLSRKTSLKRGESLKRTKPETLRGGSILEENNRENEGDRQMTHLFDAMNGRLSIDSPAKLAAVMEAWEQECEEEDHGIMKDSNHVCACQKEKKRNMNRNTL